jgi:hypothetical protein
MALRYILTNIDYTFVSFLRNFKLQLMISITCYDRTTSEMRGPSLQDRSRDSRWSEYAQTHIQAYKDMIKIEIKLLQLYLEITR